MRNQDERGRAIQLRYKVVRDDIQISIDDFILTVSELIPWRIVAFDIEIVE